MPKAQEMIAKTTLWPGQKGTKHLIEKYGERALIITPSTPLRRQSA